MSLAETEVTSLTYPRRRGRPIGSTKESCEAKELEHTKATFKAIFETIDKKMSRMKPELKGSFLLDDEQAQLFAETALGLRKELDSKLLYLYADLCISTWLPRIMHLETPND